MRFDTLTFAVFFLTVLAVYRARLSWAFRKLVLLVASLLFYAAWNPPFVLLLLGSTVVDYFIARGIIGSGSTSRRRLLLVASLTCNLGLLGFFKYSGFLVENFTWLLNSFGVTYQPLPFSVILPVGISFYTFQTLSYTIDVYRGHLKADWTFLDYALYVCFFPQLVAGPIVRSDQFLPQTLTPKHTKLANLLPGLGLVVLGLFEKVVLADGVFAPVADNFFNASTMPTGPIAWAGLFAFSGQIFCDFAGYSTCAIGVAKCLGFELPRNFWSPYAAIGVSDFWSRWHISLSTWFRDYVYIPLGGNRKGAVRTNVNLLFTMLVSGLWHGAAWTFILWGALHGMLLLLERSLMKYLQRRNPAVASSPEGNKFGLLVTNFFAAAATFMLVTLCWIPFRCRDLTNLAQSITSLCSWGPLPNRDALLAIAAIAILFLVQFTTRNSTLQELVEKVPVPITGLAVATMAYLVLTFPRDNHAFIYFQF